jgi:hypothetical protein
MSIEETTVGDITDDDCEAPSDDQRMFAFEFNRARYDGDAVGCPAVQSGVVYPSDISGVTAAYDDSVKELVDDSHNRVVVEEDVAKTAWQHAIEEVEDKRPGEYEEARSVAAELGWR